MYTITITTPTIANKTLYSPALTDNGYVVINPILTQQVNTAGTLKFTIPEINPYYSACVPVTALIKVYEDGTRIFYGRISQTKRNFYRQKEVTAEGDLAFLNDVILRPYTYSGTLTNYITAMLGKYNDIADTSRKIYKGTVSNGSTSITRANINYPTVLEEAREKLIGSSLGGYLKTRCAKENGAEKTYLDYTETSGSTGSQVIEFGKNLLNLDDYLSGEELATRVIPLGARDEEIPDPEPPYSSGWNAAQGKYTVLDTLSGDDYVTNPDAVSAYGNIESLIIDEDITDPRNLLAVGFANLDKKKVPVNTISISAVDLHLLNVNTAALVIGNYYRVVSAPHGLIQSGPSDTSNLFPLTKCKICLDNPSKSTYTFGTPGKTLTGGIYG